MALLSTGLATSTAVARAAEPLPPRTYTAKAIPLSTAPVGVFPSWDAHTILAASSTGIQPVSTIDGSTAATPWKTSVTDLVEESPGEYLGIDDADELDFFRADESNYHIALPGRPTSIATDLWAKHAYITLEGTDPATDPGSVVVYDESTGRISAPITVGVDPQGVVSTEHGASIAVANAGSKSVSIIDTASATVRAEITGLSGATSLVKPSETNDDLVYVGSSAGSVAIADVSDASVRATFAATHSTHLSLSGTENVLAGTDSTGVSVVDRPQRTQIADVDLPGIVGPAVISAAGNDIHVADASGSRLVALHSGPIVTPLASTTASARSVAASKDAFPTSAKVVYLTGEGDFVDAESAAAAAVHRGGPVLVTAKSALPSSVKSEITRLHPAQLVIVGTAARISEKVVDQLRSLRIPMTRIAEGDRYLESRHILRTGFTSARALYITVGNVPSGPAGDEFNPISTAAVAASKRLPLLEIDGALGTVPVATASAIRRLHPSKLIVVGSTSQMTKATQAALAKIAPITAYTGTIRHAQWPMFLAASYSKPTTVVLTSGETFGAGRSATTPMVGTSYAMISAAGMLHQPIVITPESCLSADAGDAITRWNPKSITEPDFDTGFDYQAPDLPLCG